MERYSDQKCFGSSNHIQSLGVVPLKEESPPRSPTPFVGHAYSATKYTTRTRAIACAVQCSAIARTYLARSFFYVFVHDGVLFIKIKE